MKLSRLAAKVSVATTRTTAVAAPTSVDRVGTLAGPGSRAKRVPATTDGEKPAAATHAEAEAR